MIIYGWRERSSVAKRTNSVNCTECGQGGVNSFTVFRYFHLYWIPFFPYSRKLWLSCEHCKATYEPDRKAIELSTPGIKLEAERAPIYYFSGIAVLIAIYASIAWFEIQNSEKYRTMLLQPKVGDLIVMKVKNPNESKSKYGVARVINVDEKEIHVTQSNYLFSSSSSAISEESTKLLLEDDSFGKENILYERPQIIKLFDSGQITAALRDDRFLKIDND